MTMGILFAYSSGHHILQSVEASRGHWIPVNWSYKQLEAAMWVLGTKLWSFGRVAGALNF